MSAFQTLVANIGFEHVSISSKKESEMFVILEFRKLKVRGSTPTAEEAAEILLPCLYKRR